MEALFGKEFGGMQPRPSSPVLHGGMYTGGSGSLSRPKSASRLQGLFNQPKSMKVSIHLNYMFYYISQFLSNPKSKPQVSQYSLYVPP